MSNKTLSILVIISLSFNFAFLGVFFYHMLRVPLPPANNPRLNIPLKLREQAMQSRKDIEPLRMDFELTRRIFAEALSERNFDEPKLIALLDRTIEKQLVMEMELGIKLIQLRKQMTPEEAANLFRKHRPFLNKFKNRIEYWKEHRKRR